MVVVGSSVLQRKDGPAIHSAVAEISQNARINSGCGDDWKVLNVLHRVSYQRHILIFFIYLTLGRGSWTSPLALKCKNGPKR